MKPLEIDVRLPLDRFALEVRFRTRVPVTGLFGPSGAGKTSLLQAIGGLRSGVTGRIALGDETWLDGSTCRPPERRGVGYVPQDGLLFPHLDVRGNLLAGARRSRAAGQEPAALLEHVAERLELGPLLGRWPQALSGGERQRVALGRALCSGPSLLLLDEPLGSLDLPLRRRILPLLRRVREELTIPMVLVSHDPVEIQALCDEVIVLEQGREVARGRPAEVLTDPAVFPIAETSGFVNVVAGTVVGSSTGESRVRLGSAGPDLIVSPATLGAGADVVVELPANQLLVATEPPSGLSARNNLAATVTAVQPLEAVTLVHAVLDGSDLRLTVEVTSTTPRRLSLEPGRRVFLVVKATSCRLHGRARATALDSG